MSNVKSINTNGVVIVDLKLIPLNKQVNIIWLSKVVKNLLELEEKTGVSKVYIKKILENKQKILKSWRDSVTIAKQTNANEKDDHDGIDVLLLECVSCCALNKITLYSHDIETLAINLKTFFEAPSYQVSEEVWTKIESIQKKIMENLTRMIIPDNIPCDVLTIFKTCGQQLLKSATYLRFLNLVARKSETESIDLLKQVHGQPIEKDQKPKSTTRNVLKQIQKTQQAKTYERKERKEEQQHTTNTDQITDDLILIENPVECIDVTAEDNDVTQHSKSKIDSFGTSKDSPTTLNSGPTVAYKIKTEPCDNVETEESSIQQELDQQVQIKNEILKNEPIEKDTNENIGTLHEHHGLGEAESMITPDCDKGEDFIQSLKFENEINAGVNGNIVSTGVVHGFEIIEFEDPKEVIKRIESDNSLSKVKPTGTNRRRNSNQSTKVGGSKNLENAGLQIKSESNTEDCSPSVLKTTNFKTRSDLVQNNIELPHGNNSEKVTPEPKDSDDIIKYEEGDGNDDDDEEIEVIYEIEDSDEEMRNELQQIIDNYRKKATNTEKASEKSSQEQQQQQQQQPQHMDNEDSLLQALPDNEDDGGPASSNKKQKSKKRKRKQALTILEDTSDSNSPSTSGLSNKNRASSKVSAKKTKRSDFIPREEKVLGFQSDEDDTDFDFSLDENVDLTSKEDEGEEPSEQITIENNNDAIRYLEHIKNYLLSRNDKVGVKLLLNLQMAFINLN